MLPDRMDILIVGAGPAGLFLANECARSGSSHALQMRFEPEGTPYSFIEMVPQNVTERLLVEALQQRGAQVEYDTAFVSAEQQADAVSVTLGHEGETRGGGVRRLVPVGRRR